MRYRTVVADPPWQYPGAGATKANATKHYPTMPTPEICALPISDLAEDDAHLWLWGTNGMLEDAFKVVRAWGFSPLTMVTWCKRGPGVGHYVRNNTEHVILASRGLAQVPEVKPISSWYEWPKGRHSAKPDAFYDLVATVSPGPYLELFARRNRLGWDTWGNEALEHVQVSST